MNTRSLLTAGVVGLFAFASYAQSQESEETKRAEEKAALEQEGATEMQQESAELETEAQLDVSQAQQKQLQAQVLGVDEKEVILDVNGAAVPMHVNHDTRIDGQMTPRTHRIESRLQQDLQPGQMVSVTYATQNLENHAMSIEKQGGQQQQPGQQQQQGMQQPPQQQQQQQGMQQPPQQQQQPSGGATY